jgi:hypothetical protein
VSLQHRLVFFLVMSKGKEEEDEDEQHKKTKKYIIMEMKRV